MCSGSGRKLEEDRISTTILYVLFMEMVFLPTRTCMNEDFKNEFSEETDVGLLERLF